MDSHDISIPILGEDDQDLKAGDVVGDYVVEKKIGEGGFGTVFRAVHPVIGKQVAIKVLARQFSAQRDMVSRFVNEARAVIQIQHRHIIDVFAFGQLDDGRHYYVMELLNGQPLDAYLEAEGPLALRQVITILRPIAKALDAAHRKGIAHRDLKPENIFLTEEEDGELFPKLLDFGIAKLLGESAQEHKTATGAPMGTPLYMSPEQCRGRDVDHRTDIYAFGILAYEMITGQLPFDGEDYVEILLKQIGEQPDPPSSRADGVSKRVDQPILWMLAKDRSKRPETLSEAINALEAAIELGDEAVRAVAGSKYSLDDRSTAKLAESPAIVAGRETALEPPLSAQVDEGKRFPIAIIGGGAVAVVIALFFVLRGGGTETKETTNQASDSPKGTPIDLEPKIRPVTIPNTNPPKIGIDVPVKSSVVHITIKGPPGGTEVYGPFGLLGIAPGKIQLSRGEQSVLLTFKADGFKTATHQLEPTENREIEIVLVAKRKPKRPSKRPKIKPKHDDRNQIENPF